MASNGCALELLSGDLQSSCTTLYALTKYDYESMSSDDQKTVLQALLPLTILLITITPSSGNTGRPFLVPQMFKSRNKLAFSTCRSNERSNIKVSVKALHLKINAQQFIHKYWVCEATRWLNSRYSLNFLEAGDESTRACNHQIRSAMANPAGV